MTVRVVVPTVLRQHTANQEELNVEAGTVKEALALLVSQYPGLGRQLYSGGGRLRNFVNVYVNGEDIRAADGESTALKDRDEVLIVPAVAGGSLTAKSFSRDEYSRYSRHLIMPEVGLEGQKKLRSASVLVVGLGGLGTPAATYLAAAGVGRIGLLDFDRVERSNLHRQVLYSEGDIGEPKAEVARDRLKAVNPNVEFGLHDARLDSSNALGIIEGYDLVLDGTDNFPTRYLVNDACVILGKRNVYASIFRFEGQASVFCAEDGPCYRCLYPEPPPAGLVPSCAEGGVLGVLPGVAGAIQASQAVSLILGKGEPLVGRLLTFDLLKSSFRELRVRKDPECPVCGDHPTIRELVDYEAFCGVGGQLTGSEVSPRELKEEVRSARRPLILDVREPFEYEIGHIEGSKLIPLGELSARVHELDSAEEMVLLCRTGARSAQALGFLKSVGFRKVRSLRGGINAWAAEVDPAIQTF